MSSSEIFKNFAAITRQQALQKKAEEFESEKLALAELENLQQKINLDPNLKKKFAKIQSDFINYPDLKNKFPQSFVNGIMLLDLTSEQK